MGLREQIQQGALFTRRYVTIANSSVSGSTDSFGKSYILLNVTVNAECRIRLYSTSQSVAIDASRTTASMDVNPAVGLVLDTYVDSGPYTLNFDPPIIGTTFDQQNNTWFNISGSDITATFEYYPIESSYATRQTLNISASSLSAGASTSGNTTTPKSFLILSASCNFSESRLRLYSRQISSVSASEQSRAFSTLPSDGSYIITDMLFDSASYGYVLSPTLQAYNLTTYGTGSNLVGYIIQNLSGTTVSNITASLYIYPIED
jgi:hypothetical protein